MKKERKEAEEEEDRWRCGSRREALRELWADFMSHGQTLEAGKKEETVIPRAPSANATLLSP